MIIDAHTHAWESWPYDPNVPDSESRGKVEQMIYEMDQNNVDIAVVICASIGDNDDNNDYVAECVRKYPSRLIQFADVDCPWTKTYHTKGAGERLLQTAIKYSLKGYTHYLREDDNGSWFFSEEGKRFLKVTEDLGLIVSMAVYPHQQPFLRELAKQFPNIIFLCHHMGFAQAKESYPFPKLKEILTSANLPNIYIKISGFAYVSSIAWEYPYADTEWIIKALYEYFGPDRLCWGSDYPVVQSYMTYKQSLEMIKSHCRFIPYEHKAKILGENMYRLLTQWVPS